MREDIRLYVEDVVNNIDNLSDYRLTNYLMALLRNDSYELDEENSLDISSPSDKLDFLLAVYDNIKRPEDKDTFIREVLDNESYLDSRIVEEFRGMGRVPEGFDDEDVDASENEEELEEDQDLDLPSPNSDTDSDIAPEEPEEKEDEKTEETVEELPAITAYKKETEALEKELEELLAKLKNSPDESTKEMDEIINNTSYPEIEGYENRISEVEAEIKNIEQEISNKTEEKARYEKLKEEYDKFYEEKSIPKTSGDYRQKMDIYNQRIKECEDIIKANNEKKTYKEQELAMLNEKAKEVTGPLYNIEVWKFAELYNKEVEKLENNLKELNEIQDKLYKESKGIPLEIYGMKTKLETQIQEMKDTFTKTIGIRSEINLNNPEFKPVLDAVKNGRKLNAEINEELDKSFRPEKKEDGLEDEELKEYIEKLKKDIEERKQNIAKYEDALKDIREIGNEIKSGKKPEDPEIKAKVENVKNKINSITDEKLREELNNELNKALGLTKDPEMPKDVKKDPKKWQKWASGIAGLLIGAAAVGLTPLGLGGAIVLSSGAQLAKNVIKKQHEKLKNENEVTDIEKTGKLAKFKEKIKSWLKDDNIVRNIVWGLNGFTIGALTTGAIEQIMGMMPSTPTPSQATPQTDPYSNIKIGESANGLDLSKGYDQANWAANNVNPESLNQAIMQDGNSIIDSVRVTKDGVTHVVDTAGKSLSEVAQQLGVAPEDLVMNITNKEGAARAWVDAGEAVIGRTL